MKNPFNQIGPGTLVAAAFIGPGTVTVCATAGVTHGFTLLWVMVLSITATIILQEMAARLGLITGKGLPEVLKESVSNKIAKLLLLILVMTAIVLGNAAYEAGNITGAVSGLKLLAPHFEYFPILIGLLAAALLYIGNYKILERVLVSLVVVMGVSFIAVAFAIKPDFVDILKGIFIPSFPEKSIFTIIGLIGTTVVPYNLFLHASLVREKWAGAANLKAMRKDTIISVILGGVVSMAIIIAATALPLGSQVDFMLFQQVLEPVYGSASPYIFAIGLFAAGLTSAITAPLAAAYVIKGCMGWDVHLKSARFRSSWFLILAIGVCAASFKLKPIAVISFAQFANGLLLPIIAGILLWLVNTKTMGIFKNTMLINAIACLVVLISLFLGCYSIYKALFL